jgi:hypothetical protein
MGDEKRLLVVLLLGTVAILGYLIGGRSSNASPPETMREASNAATRLTYPAASGWTPASAALAIPGISIAQPLAIAPRGDAAQTGLIVGQLLGSESSPLPSKLLEGLRETPATDVVDLSNTQAYRYSQASLSGSDRHLTLYTIPTSADTTEAIVCYAPAASTGRLHACEQLAGTLSIAAGRPQAEVHAFQTLTPQAGYGSQIRAAVARVNQLLGTIRPEIRPNILRTTASGSAKRLSEGLAAAAASLAALRPPAAAAGANAALSTSLTSTGTAYAALSGALLAESTPRYDAARSRIDTAEAALSAAIKNITLLGYQ